MKPRIIVFLYEWNGLKSFLNFLSFKGQYLSLAQLVEEIKKEKKENYSLVIISSGSCAINIYSMTFLRHTHLRSNLNKDQYGQSRPNCIQFYNGMAVECH